MADAILPIVAGVTPAKAWPTPHRSVGRALLLTLPMLYVHAAAVITHGVSRGARQ